MIINIIKHQHIDTKGDLSFYTNYFQNCGYKLGTFDENAHFLNFRHKKGYHWLRISVIEQLDAKERLYTITTHSQLFA